MSGEHTSLGAYQARRVEQEMSNTVFDANFFLRASQLHMRPERPEVKELIKIEMSYGTDLIEHLYDAYLVVGDEPIKAALPDMGTTTEVTVNPGTELAIDGVLDCEEIRHDRPVVLKDGDRLLHISPSVLARTLVQGGVILGQAKSTVAE